MVYIARWFQPRETRNQSTIRPEGTMDLNPTPVPSGRLFLFFPVPRIKIRGYMKPRRIRGEKK